MIREKLEKYIMNSNDQVTENRDVCSASTNQANTNDLKRVKLEDKELTTIAHYFSTIDDAKHFLQVSKKCNSSIKSVDENPFFFHKKIKRTFQKYTETYRLNNFDKEVFATNETLDEVCLYHHITTLSIDLESLMQIPKSLLTSIEKYDLYYYRYDADDYDCFPIQPSRCSFDRSTNDMFFNSIKPKIYKMRIFNYIKPINMKDLSNLEILEMKVTHQTFANEEAIMNDFKELEKSKKLRRIVIYLNAVNIHNVLSMIAKTTLQCKIAFIISDFNPSLFSIDLTEYQINNCLVCCTSNTLTYLDRTKKVLFIPNSKQRYYFTSTLLQSDQFNKIYNKYYPMKVRISKSNDDTQVDLKKYEFIDVAIDGLMPVNIPPVQALSLTNVTSLPSLPESIITLTLKKVKDVNITIPRNVKQLTLIKCNVPSLNAGIKSLSIVSCPNHSITVPSTIEYLRIRKCINLTEIQGMEKCSVEDLSIVSCAISSLYIPRTVSSINLKDCKRLTKLMNLDKNLHLSDEVKEELNDDYKKDECLIV